MKWRLFITPRVQEAIRTFPPQTKQYIRQALDDICKNPAVGKPLKDDLVGFYSFKAKRYRIVYELDRKVVTIMVIDIGPRRTIYESLIPVRRSN